MELEDYLLLLLLAAMWGASFIFIKIGVGEMNPLFLVFIRSAAATIALVPILVATRVPFADLQSHWKPGLAIGLVNSALPYALIAFGEKYIESSLAGILNATAPLWTGLLAGFWAESEGITRRQLAGLLLGFAGVVVIAKPTGSAFSSNVVGVLAVVGATLSYAFATHFSRRHFANSRPQATAFLQCVFSAVMLLPLAILFHPARTPSLAAWGAVTWLGVGATGIAMILSFRLIQRIGATRTIVVTYLIPPFAIAWGFVILHERPGPETLVALILILGGVFLNTRPGRPRTVRLGVDEAVVEV